MSKRDRWSEGREMIVMDCCKEGRKEGRKTGKKGCLNDYIYELCK